MITETKQVRLHTMKRKPNLLSGDYQDKMNRKELLLNIISSVEAAIIFVSTIFIEEIISGKYGIAASLVYMVFADVLYGMSLISVNKKTWLLKWGLSIPFSFIVISYFHITNYSVRALNWAFPDYGNPSAGSKFAAVILLLISSAMCLICGLISLFIKPKDHDRFKSVIFIITSVFAALIICVVLILERQFPTYEYIVSHI